MTHYSDDLLTAMSCARHGTVNRRRCTSFAQHSNPPVTNLHDTVTIKMLPKNILLDIFDSYMQKDFLGEAWHTLVHVCQQWRSVVFGSPHCLKLRLVCKAGTRVRETLGFWPDLPIDILIWFIDPTSDMDNVIAALEHNDRVRKVDLRGVQSFQAEKVLSVMQKPFPELTDLKLGWNGGGTVPVFPESFLGGSAPGLQTLYLDGIPTPTLRKLVLFSTNIVTLSLGDLSRSVYISPEELVTCLSALTKLGRLSFEFVSPPSLPDQESRQPLSTTRIVFPSLTFFSFDGVSDFLEDFVARIDAPLLDDIYITFFNQPSSDTSPLVKLIRRTPNFKAFKEARVIFYGGKVEVMVTLPSSDKSKSIKLEIQCAQSALYLPVITQICSPSFLPLPTVEHLYIFENRFLLFSPYWADDEIAQWLEIFHSFTAVKNLYLSNDLAPRIVPMLQELVGERVAEVLPALQNIFLQDLRKSSKRVRKAIQQFVAARQLSGYPVTVHPWKIDF